VMRIVFGSALEARRASVFSAEFRHGSDSENTGRLSRHGTALWVNQK
jgi:hypothetical protein